MEAPWRRLMVLFVASALVGSFHQLQDLTAAHKQGLKAFQDSSRSAAASRSSVKNYRKFTKNYQKLPGVTTHEDGQRILSPNLISPKLRLKLCTGIVFAVHLFTGVFSELETSGKNSTVKIMTSEKYAGPNSTLNFAQVYFSWCRSSYMTPNLYPGPWHTAD